MLFGPAGFWQEVSLILNKLLGNPGRKKRILQATYKSFPLFVQKQIT